MLRFISRGSLHCARVFPHSADSKTDSCDQEEFIELVVRIAAFYTPGTFDLVKSKDTSLADAFRTLLTFISGSRGGAKLTEKFNTTKVTGK